uniref:Uncharacterized protein n=1 Tax=viral metagenome TaxID=1070528 RepID=A0A6M3IS46_9ZZZZ
MDALRKLVIVIFGLCIAVGLSILVMIKGWGLEPKSWWWIIGVGIFGQIFAQLIVKLGITSKD